MKNKIIAVLVFTIMITNLSAQVEESDIFDHKLMFNDLYGIKEYKDALPHLKWLSKNAPEVDENVQLRGVRAVDAVLKNTSSEEEKIKLQEFSLNLYAQRIQYFGSSPTVKSLQLTAAYRYYAKNPNKYDELMSLYETSISEDLDLMSNANFLSYFDILRRAKKYKLDIDEELVLANYAQISELMDKRAKKDGYIAKIESFLTQIVALDCERIEQVFGSKIKDDEAAVSNAKMLVNLSLKNDCTDSEIFNEALGYVAKYDPTTSVLMYLAKKSMKKNELSSAEMYFGKALAVNEDSDTESDIYFNLAKIFTLKKQKTKASEYALKAIKENNSKEAYALIGNLYMSSFSECVGDKDMVKRRSVFIAAYNMFEKANDKVNMELAKAQFPSMDEIFLNNYKLGEVMQVDCWFHETVTLQKREG